MATAAQQRAAELTRDQRLRAARLLMAAEMGFELGQPALVARLLDEAERLELGRRDRARAMWLREIFNDGAPGDASEVQRLVDSAEESARENDQELTLSLLHAAAVRCWWADAGDAARAGVLASVGRLPVDRDDPRVLDILALAAPIDSGAAVAQGVSRASASSAQDPAANRLLGFAAHAVGDFEQSFGLLGRAASGLRDQGRLGLLAQVLTVRAWDGIHLGRFEDAERDADESGRLASETGQPVWTAGTQIARALLAGVRGEYQLADALALAAEQVIVPRGLSNLRAVLQLARGVTALGAGNYADAFDHLRRMLDRAGPAFHPTESHTAMRYLAEAAVHAGRRDDARGLLPDLAAVASRTPAPLLHASLGYARAVLADDSDAEDLYRSALAAERDESFDGARLRLAYGVWLRRRRRVAESRDPLREARDVFDRLGAGPWGHRARQELRASGERSPMRQTPAGQPLSPQELQIARMAADGLSNRDIAERLFLSHRTVGSHLYRIFPKLGVVARSDLRGALAGR